MIQPKYEIGQEVFCVDVSWSSTSVTCPDCLGQREWKVSTPSGEEWNTGCGTCSVGFSSTGVVKEWGDNVRKVRRTIGSIRVDTADKEGPVTYMCYETGIGSGNVYQEARLFADKAEADAYGERELARVKGLRQKQELEERERNKKGRSYHKPRKTGK